MHLVHQDRSQETEVKVCKQCSRQLHEAYPHDLCPMCMEYNLFNEVKDYIRNNDVHEQDVAEHFNIPLSKVRGWIREGRIQYKGESKDKISGVYCRVCGKPIAFGVTCPECHSLENLQIVANQQKVDNAAMRFLGK